MCDQNLSLPTDIGVYVMVSGKVWLDLLTGCKIKLNTQHSLYNMKTTNQFTFKLQVDYNISLLEWEIPSQPVFALSP